VISPRIAGEDGDVDAREVGLQIEAGERERDQREHAHQERGPTNASVGEQFPKSFHGATF